MKRYQVIFRKDGYIRHTCIQQARSAKEAIEFARMYSGLNCPAQAVDIDDESGE